MKKHIMKILIATTVFMFVSAGAAFSEDRFDRRLERQRARIHQGVVSSELTFGERQDLKREQKRIKRYQNQAQNDGMITSAEHRQLNRMQNRASEHIYDLKHNDNRRHPIHPCCDQRHCSGYKRHQHHHHHNGCRLCYVGYHYSGLYSRSGSFFSFSVGGKLD